MTDKEVMQPEPVVWAVYEGGTYHDVYFAKEDAEYMASLRGSHTRVVPLYPKEKNT
jgi:hypothetical protein